MAIPDDQAVLSNDHDDRDDLASKSELTQTAKLFHDLVGLATKSD